MDLSNDSEIYTKVICKSVSAIRRKTGFKLMIIPSYQAIWKDWNFQFFISLVIVTPVRGNVGTLLSQYIEFSFWMRKLPCLGMSQH